MEEVKKIIKVQKTGNQLYVNISKEVEKKLDIKKGDSLELITDNGKIVLSK